MPLFQKPKTSSMRRRPRFSRKPKSVKSRRRGSFEALEARAVLSAISVVEASPLFVEPDLNAVAAVTNSTVRGYTPSQVAQAYGFSSISFNSGTVAGNGAGQTIAIVDAYNDPNITSDLHVFDQTFGLANPSKFSVVNEAGGSQLPTTDSGWSEEIALDVEWAHAMAPGASILLVEANSSSISDLMAAVNYARNASGVSVVSMSWGSSEFYSETRYDSYFTTPSGHNGVTFIASAGDSGAGASWPAVSPNVLSVGGTTLQISGSSYAGESAWSGSGGGYSQVESEPSYQQSVQSSGRRSSPDVSYDANPNTGFAVYDTVATGGRTGWFQIGGTSAGSPQWAALVAIANQGRALAGQGTLSGTPSQIYSLATSDFHDITSGSNGYSARAGYDLVTGRGSPNAAAVVSGLDGNSSVTTNPTPTPTQPPTQTPPATRVVYEWIYWNHRWWLVVITLPAAGAAADDGNIDGAMDQITAAIAGGATHPAPSATMGVSSSATSAAAEQNTAAVNPAQPALLAAWTDIGVGATAINEQFARRPARRIAERIRHDGRGANGCRRVG